MALPHGAVGWSAVCDFIPTCFFVPNSHEMDWVEDTFEIGIFSFNAE